MEPAPTARSGNRSAGPDEPPGLPSGRYRHLGRGLAALGRFFEGLPETPGMAFVEERALAVVLTGTGADGSVGIAR
ncbi:hypothetical protein [Luteibacter sp.]|uniref:hypothetical protein n=1 Tax=Luteibacter sp. TaxID=1886636 RepID=UPI002F42F3FE